MHSMQDIYIYLQYLTNIQIIYIQCLITMHINQIFIIIYRKKSSIMYIWYLYIDMHYIIWQCIHGYNSCIKHINHRTACHITKPKMWTAILPQSDPRSVRIQINCQVPSAIVASRARGVRVQLHPKKPPARRPPRDSMNRTVDVVGNGENFWVDNDFNVWFVWEGCFGLGKWTADVSWPLILMMIMI